MKQIVHKLNKVNWLKAAEYTLALAILVLPIAKVFADLPSPDCRALDGVRCDSYDLKGLIYTILRWALGLAGLVAVAMLIMGGFRYITSAGNEETAGKGKKTIFNALIGLAIIILSFVIVQVVSRTASTAGTSL